MKFNFELLFKITILFSFLLIPFIISSHSYGVDLSTSVLFCLSCIVPVFCSFIKKEDNTYDFFQPGTIFILFYYVYIIFPAFYDWKFLDYSSNWVNLRGNAIEIFDSTLLTCILGAISFGLGYKWIVRRKSLSPLKISVNVLDEVNFKSLRPIIIILSVFITLGLVGKYETIKAYGEINIYETLSPSKRGAALKSIGGIPTYISYIQYFFDWGILLLTFYSTYTSKLKKIIIIIYPLSIFLIYLTVAKRSAVIPMFLLPLTWYHYCIKEISMRQGLIYSFLLFSSSFILLFVRILVPLISSDNGINGVVIQQILSDPFVFYFNTPELSVFDMVMLAIQDGQIIIDENGGILSSLIQSNFAPILYLVPRFLWPDKPTFRELGQVFYQHTIGAVQNTDTGFTISIFSTLYLWGNIFGVIVGMFLVGKIARFVYFRFIPTLKSNNNIVSLFLYSLIFWNFFQFLRFGSFGFLILLFIQAQSQGILLLAVILNKK